MQLAAKAMAQAKGCGEGSDSGLKLLSTTTQMFPSFIGLSLMVEAWHIAPSMNRQIVVS
jgi:hypothetical protein